MTSSADPRLAALALALAVAPAAVLAFGSARAANGFERRVAELVAERWQVPADAVRLAWSGRPEALPAAGDSLRLIGPGPDGWLAVTYVLPGGQPGALRARAGVEDTIRVAARALPRGAALQAGDLRAEARTAWGPPARTPEQTPAPGWELRRPVAAGQSLAWPASAPPPLVRAGEPVRVEWRRGAVTVATSGVAQNAARAGETVRVRVPGRLGRLQGSATGPGTVTLVDGGGR